VKDGKVLVLQHVEVEGPSLIARALEDRELPKRFARPFTGEPVPRHVDDVIGLIVMGGPMNVDEIDPQSLHPFQPVTKPIIP